MSKRKLILAAAMFLLSLMIAWAALNIIVDPFNAFGDRVLEWDSYTQTLNPRNSKAVYVTKNFDKYDSYIIGASSAASFLPETLNKYYDAKFFNMFHYNSDISYDKKLVSYLIENDDVKHIFLVLGLDEAVSVRLSSDSGYYKISGESAISYYSRYLFSPLSHAIDKLKTGLKDKELPFSFGKFIPETGVYDRRVEDSESIGALADYFEKNKQSFFRKEEMLDLNNIDFCIENVREIKKMCDDAGVKLIVTVPPVCDIQLNTYTDETVDEYLKRLTSVTEYWNFAVSRVTYDQRFFYDNKHIRNATGNMVVANIFENNSVYYPDDFGTLCSEENYVSIKERKKLFESNYREAQTKTIPILIYHNFSVEGAESSTSLHPDTFSRHMTLIKENGYSAVSFGELIAFAEKGTSLPKKPVIITFDDGYMSNYEYAYPILEKLGLKGTVFAIGVSIGHKEFYKDTKQLITPHFGKEEIKEMLESGVMSVHSHTYDMHQWAPFEKHSPVRDSVLPFECESEENFVNAIKEDVKLQNLEFEKVGLNPSDVLAYPNGLYTPLSNIALIDCGYKALLTTDESRVNVVVPGLPQSLIGLGRMNISDYTTDEDILNYLNKSP